MVGKGNLAVFGGSNIQGRSWVFVDGGAYYKLLTIT